MWPSSDLARRYAFIETPGLLKPSHLSKHQPNHRPHLSVMQQNKDDILQSGSVELSCMFQSDDMAHLPSVAQ